MPELKSSSLVKPVLTRTETNGLTTTIKMGTEEPIDKIVIAYDIAGNAIECSIDEILNNKYRPKPDFGITEVPKQDKKTRSGKEY
jgi:hypothetical protein